MHTCQMPADMEVLIIPNATLPPRVESTHVLNLLLWGGTSIVVGCHGDITRTGGWPAMFE